MRHLGCLSFQAVMNKAAKNLLYIHSFWWPCVFISLQQTGGRGTLGSEEGICLVLVTLHQRRKRVAAAPCPRQHWEFYLFIFGERGREGEKHRCVRETSIDCLPHPDRGPGPQPRPVPWWESTGDLSLCRWRPTDWATLVRVHGFCFVFLSNLLRGNLNNIKLTISKWTIQWQLVHSQRSAITTSI